MFKLGTIVTDTASGLTGSLMHLQIESNGFRWYNFQPNGLNPEDGSPAARSWITEDRVIGESEPDPKFPLETLGIEAEDTVTGFKGVVTAIIVHLNGCIHLNLQPKGRQEKTGKMLPAHDFDIRMLKGPAIPLITATQLKESRQTTPSPDSCDRPSPRSM